MQSNLIGNTLTVKITGDMDHFHVGFLRSEIDRKIREIPIKNLVFDLSELEFMDSSGVGLLLGRFKRMQEMDGRVFIAGAKPSVERVINISGLHKIIPVYETMDKAIDIVCGVK